MNKKFKIVLVALIVLIILSGSIILFTNNRNSTKLNGNYNNSERENDNKENNNNNLDSNDKTDNVSNEDELDKDKNEEVEDNKKDEVSLEENKGNNEANNTNKDDKKEDNKVENSTTNKPTQSGNSNQTSQNGNTNQTNQNNQTSSKVESSNTTDNENNKGDDKKEEVTEPNTPKDENDSYRKKIESTYGVTIKYGDEIGDYKPKMLTPTKLLDSNKIKTDLEHIEIEFKKYPTGFFKDFKGMPLTIYLVESVPNNTFSGYTDREFMNDIKITIVDGYFLSYTLNHEIMHYIDAYLEIKMYPNDPYQEYMKLNPSGFSYGSEQEKYNYGYNNQIKGAYFLNSYSQLNPREDRAEIFKQMITRPYKPVGMFDDGEVIKKKALVISEQIKAYFPSAKRTQYWDKIIG